MVGGVVDGAQGGGSCLKMSPDRAGERGDLDDARRIGDRVEVIIGW